jgi:hypothetical protein
VGLLGVVLGLVLLGGKILLAVQSVTVDSDLGVSCHHSAVSGENERVDLHHVAILFPEASVELLEKMNHLIFVLAEV